MKKNEEKIEKEKTCDSHDCGCQHGEECTCGDHCDCGDSCTCGDHCECGDECTCGEECECHKKEYDEEVLNEEAGQYLAMAQRLQADFDNYRKRVAEQLEFQKNEGKKSVIEVFLPCLDTFKEAKKLITDEKVLSGVNMIENKILDALKTLKVEKIESVGQKYDHNLHEVIAVMHDESKENDIILDEFQAGYMFNGKVIRYSKVIVNKKED